MSWSPERGGSTTRRRATASGAGRVCVLQLTWRLTAAGGVPAVSRMLLGRLDPTRFDVHALSVRPLLREDRLEALGPQVAWHSLGYRGGHTQGARAALALRVGAAVRSIAPDVLHVHSGSAWMSLPTVVSAPRTRRLLDVHDAPFTGKHGRLTDSVEMAMARRWGYHTVVHSVSVRTDTARALGRPREDVSLIPLGVEPREPTPEAGVQFRRQLGLSSTDRVVLYAGSAPTKNVPLFLEVARDVLARFPADVAFVLLGDSRVVDTVAGADRIHVVPPQHSVVPALEAADVFLSTADYEGFGLAITEAMYTGVPVVSTAVGGVVDQVVHGQTGLLAPARDRGGLVKHVCDLLDNDGLRRRMGVAAQRRVQGLFTSDRVVADFERLYQRLVSEPRRPGRSTLAGPERGVPPELRVAGES